MQEMSDIETYLNMQFNIAMIHHAIFFLIIFGLFLNCNLHHDRTNVQFFMTEYFPFSVVFHNHIFIESRTNFYFSIKTDEYRKNCNNQQANITKIFCMVTFIQRDHGFKSGEKRITKKQKRFINATAVQFSVFR